MYQTFGDYLIAEQVTETQKNSFGLIMDANVLPRYKVVSPPVNYTDLKDRIVILTDPIKAMPLPDKKHVSIHYQSIVAVEA